MRTFRHVYADLLRLRPWRFLFFVVANVLAYILIGTHINEYLGVNLWTLGVMFCLNPLLMSLWVWSDGDVPAPVVFALIVIWALIWAAGLEWCLRRFLDRPKDSDLR